MTLKLATTTTLFLVLFALAGCRKGDNSSGGIVDNGAKPSDPPLVDNPSGDNGTKPPDPSPGDTPGNGHSVITSVGGGYETTLASSAWSGQAKSVGVAGLMTFTDGTDWITFGTPAFSCEEATSVVTTTTGMALVHCGATRAVLTRPEGEPLYVEYSRRTDAVDFMLDQLRKEETAE